MYEIFEHTADLGLRVRAADLPRLFEEAGQALSSVLCENPSAIEPREDFEIDVAADRPDELLHDWLDELLYCFNVKKLLFAKFAVTVDDRGLRAVLRGGPIDRQRHTLGVEVKAITYHALKVERLDDAWLAEVIVDI